jgi:hypothetical protein
MVKKLSLKYKVSIQKVNSCEKDKKVFQHTKDDIKGLQDGFHTFNTYYY